MLSYEIYDNAGEVSLGLWKQTGIEAVLFDLDGTLTSFHDDVLNGDVVEGLRAQGLANIFPNVAIASNSTDAAQVRKVAKVFGETLGVNVYAVSKTDAGGYLPKPHPEMGKAAAQNLRVSPNQLGVIGDRRLADVTFGHHLGAGAIALCEKVGMGDAKWVPSWRKLERPIVAAERQLRIAHYYPKKDRHQNAANKN
jgi:FMN phosphatase YigB (HAD superfamily)